MKSMPYTFPFGTQNSFSVAAALLVCAFGLAGATSSSADESAALGTPVEDDMHEFMEYVFQPTYLRLKASMAELTADKANWKAIKSDGLILAESANLLSGRNSEGEALWQKHASETRQAGATLYAAAKAKDVEQTRASYVSMLTRCNACHQDFADGEHQLKP